MKKIIKIVSQEHTATEKESESELDEEHVCSRSCFAIAHTRGGSLDHFSAITRTRRRGFDRLFAGAENPRFEMFFFHARERERERELSLFLAFMTIYIHTYIYI